MRRGHKEEEDKVLEAFHQIRPYFETTMPVSS